MRSIRRSTRKPGMSFSAHTVDLPLEEKLAYGGALVSAIATLVPWFSFSDGNAFNGLQNVTWLIGYSILGLSLLVLVPWAAAPFNARIPSLLTRQSLHWAVSGALTILLSFIALSVYVSFEWIALRSDIHFGPYVALAGGVMVLCAALLNRSKGRRSHVHLAHMERPTAVPDEEIERYLKKDPVPVPSPRAATEDSIGESRQSSAKRSDNPPAMFDL